MDQDPDSWIRMPAFDWTPEAPLRLEPRVRGKIKPEAEPVQEPRFDNPELREPAALAVSAIPIEPQAAPAQAAPEAMAAETIVAITAPAAAEMPVIPKMRDTTQAPAVPVKAQKAAEKSVGAKKPAPRFVPEKEFIPPAKATLYMARMSVGLAQGFGLFALFALKDYMDPYIYAGSLMVLWFAPLLLLAGLGRMRFLPLLVWAVFASLLLAAVGAYHHWRTQGSDGGHPGLALLVLTSLFLFVGQSIAQARVDNYSSYFRSAWRLAIRIVLCAMVAGLAWAAGGAAIGYMRAHYPELQFAPLIVPMVALSVAMAAQLTGDRFLGALQEGVMFVFVIALPFLILGGLGVVGLGAPGFWHPALWITVSLSLALIVGINASYRDGTVWRAYWRRRAEFAGSLMLVPLAMLAGLALAARVQEYGWTDNRIFAAAGLMLMGGYALCYAGAAMIGMGGGGWMQRIEGGNLALAFAGLALIGVLASPIADPARLGVATQIFRLDQHKVSPDAFDFTWLRDGGLRFGREALTGMAAQKGLPGVARGAFLALNAVPEAARPSPTEIGANIQVHQGQALPAGLLARDWRGVSGAPPCLTAASLRCDAFFADLDGDGRQEVLLAYGNDARWWASVMKEGKGGGWYVAGTLAAPPCPGSLTALRNGQFTAVRPANNWRDLLVDGLRLSVAAPSGPEACPLL